MNTANATPLRGTLRATCSSPPGKHRGHEVGIPGAHAPGVGDPIHFVPGTGVVAADCSLAQAPRFQGLFLSFGTPLCGSPFPNPILPSR
ncbi:MAG TPA: hypothetical protein VFR47_00205 [Anaerolineales bacterium]|nr:hypothetical protein [Anaerolineales bacterium]